MKKYFYLLQQIWLLVLIGFISIIACKAPKVAIAPHTIPKPKPTSDKIKLASINLPLSKDSIGYTIEGGTGQSSSTENQHLPDEYGKKFNGYKSLPSYDINNRPISVWFIKDADKYVGFIVAGHATKSVCEIASIEVREKLKAIDSKNTAIFSFGIGYNLQAGTDWNETYNALLQTMEEKFVNLALQYSDQVTVETIKYEEYHSYLMLLKQHISTANDAKNWDTHIVEYKLNNFPLIAPFYYTSSKDIIQIEIPKTLFGQIPTSLVYSSYEKSLTSEEQAIKGFLEQNEQQIQQLQNYSPEDAIIPIWDIGYWKVGKERYYKKRETLIGYSPPPKGLVIVQKNEQGKIVSERPITLQEALGYLNDPGVVSRTDKKLINELRDWQQRAQKEISTFKQRKKAVKDKVQAANIDLQASLTKIKQLQVNLKNGDNQDYLIDAFLRGWVFDAGDEHLNRQLDNWYRDYRQLVWNYILENIPNAEIENKIGGVFYADDVFFQVEAKQNTFLITPYKVVGGEFVQVIDKLKGISHLHSPFNYRFIQKEN